MALQTVKGSKNIPEGAVRVTKEEALNYQRILVRDWPKETDVVFLRNGTVIACLITFISTIPCSSHFRPLLNLGKTGRMVVFLPCTTIPVLSVAVSFDKYVTQKTLLKSPDCPMCMVLPYTAYQLFQGLIYPTVLGLVSSAFVASISRSTNVPDIVEFPKFIKFVKTLLKPGLFKFQIVAAVQIATSFFLPYMQMKELSNIGQKLNEEEYNENLDSM